MANERPRVSVLLDTALRARIDALIEDGWELWHRFDVDVRRKHFHPFVAADYEHVLDALVALRSPGSGQRFLEWGSATGVITIMADLLGFEAYGIELDPDLVNTARELADRHHSTARFAHGSFLPAGYHWKPASGDGRLGTIGEGESAYPKLGHPLEDFHLVYAYPWMGEEAMMHDLMRAYGGRDARLLLNDSQRLHLFHGGREIELPRPPMPPTIKP